MKAFRSIVLALLLLSPALSWAQLRKGEMSVDYRVEDGRYVAYVNRAGWKFAMKVELCGEEDLRNLPVNHTLYDEVFAGKACSLVFGPLEKYARKGDRIYFCPKGRLYFINLAALVDGDGRRLCEKYHFFRLSDIRALPSDPAKRKIHTILLYGGMNYYASLREMSEVGSIYHTKEMHGYCKDLPGAAPEKLYLGTMDDGTRAGCNKLKASKGEVKFIFGINPLVSRVHTGADAIEELFKMETRYSVEYAVHISTHCVSSDTVCTLSNTGLLFSGAGHTLAGRRMPQARPAAGIPFELPPLNDGILYGVEIAALDMRNCTLVVLAACNTAAGTVTQDGITGLQSAFKDAGAGTLLLTLWSVNDEATSEFMKIFYANLLSGKTKHESLELARKELMQSSKFRNPIYWAPFIMLD